MSNTNNSLTHLALQKFKKSFWGVFSFWFIVAIGFVSIFAYVIAPDNSQYANQMHISIHSKKPGFKISMLSLPSSHSHRLLFVAHFCQICSQHTFAHDTIWSQMIGMCTIEMLYLPQ